MYVYTFMHIYRYMCVCVCRWSESSSRVTRDPGEPARGPQTGICVCRFISEPSNALPNLLSENSRHDVFGVDSGSIGGPSEPERSSIWLGFSSRWRDVSSGSTVATSTHPNPHPHRNPDPNPDANPTPIPITHAKANPNPNPNLNPDARRLKGWRTRRWRRWKYWLTYCFNH